MNVKEVGTSAFQLLECELNPGESIIMEPGAMASQQTGIIATTSMNGSFFKAFGLKFLGGESFFISECRNRAQAIQKIHISQPIPGDIQMKNLNGEEIFLEVGSFIARTAGVSTRLKWSGLASWIAGEGLFKLAFSGKGSLWYGCYGAVIEKEITGSLIVDSGHLLMWPDTVELKLKLPSGIFSSIVSKEGFVLQLEGHGKVQLQSRSVKGLAQWLNVRFW